MKTASLSIASNAAELQRRLQETRAGRASIGFVPTMGALHAGHGALIRRARNENDLVAVSIFVNPLQFDRKTDLDAYPRNLDADVAFCAGLGADLIYAPAPADLYPREQLSFVDLPALEQHLCGRFRPGHFRGVATVVLKLLNIVQPRRAYFGEKDAQQLAIVRRMVEDLNVPVQIVPVTTVREPDGLALSSRNVRLTPPQRAIAPKLYRALQTAADLFSAGTKSVGAARAKAIADLISEPAIKLEYFEVCDPLNLQPLSGVHDSALIAGAVFFGEIRLIDNFLWRRV